jgi:photosystem II stability/assembly factor-like uncharacterized protein
VTSISRFGARCLCSGLAVWAVSACGTGSNHATAPTAETPDASNTSPDASGTSPDAGSTLADAGSSFDAHRVIDATPTGTPPKLTPGVWVDITPAGVNLAAGCCTTYPNVGFNSNTFGVDSLEIDPSNPYTLYISVDVEGIWRTTDGGTSWTRLGTPPPQPNYGTTVSYLDSPLRVRVDPNDSRHLYATEGVRGNALGFWVSHDGGDTWTQPPGFVTAEKMATNDVTTMVIDPTDFSHVLIGSHSPWANGPAGILETKDGGNTFVLHPPAPAWTATGTIGINFFFDPALGIGNAQTWIASIDGSGIWRTTDSGQTWTMLSSSGSIHGGNSELYFTKNGYAYAGANHNMVRSTDRGTTWSTIGPSTQDGYYQVIGDGNVLYAGQANTGKTSTGPISFITSPESDGVNWTPYQGGAQTFVDGPATMRFDATNRILYSASWDAGVWALKVLP